MENYSNYTFFDIGGLRISFHANLQFSVDDNTTSKCIHNVATTYGCKISQLYKYKANEYGYDAKCE